MAAVRTFPITFGFMAITLAAFELGLLNSAQRYTYIVCVKHCDLTIADIAATQNPPLIRSVSLCERKERFVVRLLNKPERHR
jgi:hypothetical protein